MTIRRLALALIASLALLVALAWAFIRPPARVPPDLPALNDIASQLAADAAALGSTAEVLPRPPGVPDYAVLDSGGRLVAATGPRAATSLADAVARQDTVLALRDGEHLLGQVLFATGDESALAAGTDRLRWAFTIAVAAAAVAVLLALWRLDRAMLRPFREMTGFARQVAAGDLDAPLRMDQANAFGAFTEAFDLMRQELAAGRDRERPADRAKRELVASLGHDRKTPVASIKAVAEL
ncbi:MAG: hypothetical protein LBK95_07855, partial [Bifidobacteriaceae bacterium]|nr:hypothetical protein [Bifidobacteriaceae bacterium]